LEVIMSQGEDKQDQINLFIYSTLGGVSPYFRQRRKPIRARRACASNALDLDLKLDEEPGFDYGAAKVLEIEFPEDGALRARKVVTRSRARSTIKYPSWKNGRMCQAESPNECNAFRLLDCDPTVSRFSEQPCQIRFGDGRFVLRHFPDILAQIGDENRLIEVKTDEDAEKEEVKQRTLLMARELPRFGYSYVLMKASELSLQPRLSNFKQILRFSRYTPTEWDFELIREILHRRGALVWKEACAGAYGPRGRQILCNLVLRGNLFTDLHASWSSQTQFYPTKGAL
jgi:hypothetical protein